MKHWIGVLCLSAVAVLAGAPAAKPESALMLTHVTVIDITAGVARADQAVVISGGKIAAVGPSATVRSPKGSRIIDARLSSKFG